MGLGTGYAQQTCNIARALEVLGERWTMLILRDCFYGVRRFSDLLAHLDISRAVLTDRLATLVDAGLLERHAESGHPTYELTEAGIATWPALFALARWGERFTPQDQTSGRTFVHAGCDAELDDRGRCPSCGGTPEPHDVVTRPGPGGGGARSDAVSLALREPRRLLTPLVPPPARV
jgi:DNA-binding HxlR family transcriptional regulator